MKRKFSEFITRLPVRLYALLAAILAFAFFSNDFGLVDIQKTAIILAAGIDKTETGFSLTAQIAVPKSEGQNSGGTSSVEIDGEGKTVSDCIAQIYAKTGWVPKFIFCDLLVIGETFADTDVFSALDFFLRNEYMSDSCHLAMCEGKASELITSKSAIDDTSAFAIEKLFSDAAEKSGTVCTTTLKQFSIGYYGVSQSGYMPLIGTEDSENDVSSGSESGGSGSSSGEQQPKNKIYDAEQTALFSEGKLVSRLSRKETFAFNLLQGRVFSGALTVQHEGTDYSLSVLKNGGDYQLNMDGAPKAELSLDITVRLANRGTSSTIEDISKSTVGEEILGVAKERLEHDLSSLWENSVKAGCDLFYLTRQLYRSSLARYRDWKDTLLVAVTPEYKVEMKAYQ